MLKPILFTICKEAIIDQRTGALSVINIIERINYNVDLEEIPVEGLKLSANSTIVFRAILDEKKKKGTQVFLTFENMDGKETTRKDITHEMIQNEFSEVKILLHINGFLVNQSGKYTIKIIEKTKVQESTVAELPVIIELNLKKK